MFQNNNLNDLICALVQHGLTVEMTKLGTGETVFDLNTGAKSQIWLIPEGDGSVTARMRYDTSNFVLSEHLTENLEMVVRLFFHALSGRSFFNSSWLGFIDVMGESEYLNTVLNTAYG